MPNKTNPNSPLGITVQLEILNQLSARPRSTNQLVDILHRPYSTIRQAIIELEDTGQIAVANNRRNGSIYRLSNGIVPSNKIMPLITMGNDKYRLIQLLTIRKQEMPQAAKAVYMIPKHVVRILKAAQELFEGNNTRALSLPKIKFEVEKDLQSLEAAVKIYKQILSNEKLWNPDSLKTLPNDTNWDQTEIDITYEHFFPNG